MMTHNICEMLSVKTLLSGDDYLIPMYQRNYAWEESHLSQLVQDVYDSCASNKNYYIGTLVVYDRNNGSYETVDGQQRLTTLNIILCALRNEFGKDEVDTDWYKRVNISYEFRERSTQTLTALYSHTSDGDFRDAAIRNMYLYVRRTIESIVQENRKSFFDYLFNKVFITRVILPADTDLNHYFEIMNSRGEQLEKHEILKALIMRSSSADKNKSWLVGQIWEACSDMDRYVPLNFSKELRDRIFGTDWNLFKWNTLDDLVKGTSDIQKSVQDEQFSINDVVTDNSSVFVKEEEKEGDRFESVIKFPGFLLQVLRVMTGKDIPLDDKRLLYTFNEFMKQNNFSDEFILKMLELRFLFDRFVIKRDYIKDSVNGEISILTLTKQSGSSFSYNNTYIDSDENKRTIMIESMFHVSLPSQNYKHWLCAVLKYVNEHTDGIGLANYMENLAKVYMFGRFLAGASNDGFYYEAIFNNVKLKKPENITFPTFDQRVDFFIFNYIDYCLWRKDRGINYDFTSRSSVEHFYPQHPLSGDEMDSKHLHSIGNLCLISASKNSELSNYSPSAKTEHYGKVGFDSLKQKVMMDVVNTNKANSSDPQKIWWNAEIENHYAEIKALVLSSYDELGK